MTSQQKIEMSLRGGLIVKQAADLINCEDSYVIRLVIRAVEEQLNEMEEKSREFQNSKPK
jgi:hypothetical protein